MWAQVGEREYELTYMAMQFDQQGTWLGRRKSWLQITLGDQGDTLTGRTREALIDLAGKQTPSPEGTVSAVRVTVEDFSQAPAPPG